MKKTIFDNGPRGDLNVRFTRNLATIDHQLVRRAVNEPRTAPAIPVFDRYEWSTKITFAGGGAWKLLGAGEDHDTITPLAVCFTLSNGDLKIVRGADYQVVKTIACLTDFGYDLLNSYSNKKTLYRHRPVSANICEGIITLGCEVLFDTTGVGGWQKAYEAFLYSNDLGTTWSFAPSYDFATGNYSDYPTPIVGSLGRTRMADWSYKNYFPSPPKKDPMNAAWQCATDYLANSGSPGGQGYLWKTTRDGANLLDSNGVTKKSWVVHPIKTFGPYVKAEKHAHCGGVVELYNPATGKTELHYILVFGDGTPNEILRWILPDINLNYLDPSNWIEQRGFHGDGTDLIDDQYANQVANLCPGPEADVLLAGSDTQYGQVIKMTVPISRTAKADLKVLYGSVLATESGNTTLHMHAKQPYKNGGWTSHNGEQIQGAKPHAEGPLYSKDGYNFGQIRSGQISYAYLYGNDIIQIPDTTATLTATKQPTNWNVRNPITIAPGGSLHSEDANFILTPHNGFTVTRCTKDGSGNYLWPAGTAKAGQIIDPQPPTLGWVFYINCPESLATDGTIFELLDGSAPAGPIAFARMLLMNLGDYAATPGLIYGTLGFTFGSGTWSATLPVKNQWLPYPWPKDYNGNSSFNPDYIVGTGTLQQVNLEMFLAIDAMCPGPYGPYPMLPKAAGNPELLAVDGLACGTNWTIAVQAAVPHDSWDQQQLGLLLASWPLFTVWGNATNYIEFSIVKGASATATGTLRAAVKSNNVAIGNIDITGIWLNKHDPIGIIVSQVGANIEVSARLGGPPTKIGTIVASLNVKPTEVRFSNNDQSTVVPLVINAVAVDNATSSDATARQALFEGTTLFVLDSLVVPDQGFEMTGDERAVYDGFSITPDSAINLAVDTNAIYVGTTGDLDVTLASGKRVLFKNVPVGQYKWRIRRVWATTTTASNLVGLL